MTIINPDQTRTEQISFNFHNPPSTDPNKFIDGLMKEQRTFDSAGHLLQKTTFTWEKGGDGAPRLQRTETTDELTQVLATNYDQYGDNNSVGRVREYDYDGGLMRTTHHTYISYQDSDLNLPINGPAYLWLSHYQLGRVNQGILWRRQRQSGRSLYTQQVRRVHRTIVGLYD